MASAATPPLRASLYASGNSRRASLLASQSSRRSLPRTDAQRRRQARSLLGLSGADQYEICVVVSITASCLIVATATMLLMDVSDRVGTSLKMDVKLILLILSGIVLALLVAKYCLQMRPSVRKAHEARLAATRAALKKLPRFESTVADLEALPDDCRSCPVCLDHFEEGCEQLVLPCFHVFHSSCVEEWLGSKHACPICRHEVTATGGEQGTQDAQDAQA